MSFYFPISVCVAVIVKTRGAVELLFRDIGAIAVELGIVFQRRPRQPVMAFETAEKAPEIDDCISDLTATRLITR